MAGPLITEQQVMTYLFLLLLPTTIYVLCLLAYPTPHQELDSNDPEDSPLAPGGKTSRQLKKEGQEI
jgi:hypothetical protein